MPNWGVDVNLPKSPAGPQRDDGAEPVGKALGSEWRQRRGAPRSSGRPAAYAG